VTGVRPRQPVVLAVALILAALVVVVAWPDQEAGPAPMPDATPSSRPRAIQVVSVTARASGRVAETATGFTVGRGLVVTVAHLVDDRPALSVRAGARRVRRARVLELDPDTDLALLAVPGLPVGARAGARGAAGRIARRSRAPEGGTQLLLLRASRVTARPAPLRRRIDASVADPGGRRVRRRPALELAASVRAGDSGAPVLTSDGELAGVVFARSRNRTGTAYAVDVAAVAWLLRGRERGPSR
jgi:S1-C subfamily serine protease